MTRRVADHPLARRLGVRGRGPLVAAVLLVALVALAWPGVGATQTAFVTPFSWPVTALPGQFVTPLGEAPLSAPGEVWGIAQTQGVATRDAPTDSGKMALVRQRGDGAWQYVSRARSLTGETLNFAVGGTGPAHGRVTPRGGVVLALSAAPGRLLARRPNGELREVAGPDDGLLGGRDLIGGGRVTFAAFDEGTEVGAYVAPLAAVEDEVLRFDGARWTEEPVEVAGAPTRFTIGAIAVGPDGAWLVGSDGSGLTLFRRDAAAAGGPAWKPVTIAGMPSFATTSDARPLTHPAEGLTATDGRLWVDGAVTKDGTEYTFTLAVDARNERVDRSWCNAPGLCDGPLEFELAAGPEPEADGDIVSDGSTQQLGYRSFAWPGGAYGTRVVTNPRVDGAADSASYGVFDGASFVRVKTSGRRSASGQVRAYGAFTSITNGWLSQSERSVIRVASAAVAPRLQAYPLPVRRPLKAVIAEPGRSPADPAAAALAVGYNGQVLRFNPVQGWLPEPLPSGSGRATPQLNAVAWPELRRAHAVGEKGSMWLYRAEAGIWERDEGVPLDSSEDRFVGIAFQPGNTDRGYAVAQEGRILRYGKSWEQENAPDVGELFGVAFAGSQAMIVGSKGLLVNDGGEWRVDEQVRDLLTRSGGASPPPLLAVAGLADGGAVVAGDRVVLIRDSASSPWRLSEHPIDALVTAVSAVRDGATVRAVTVAIPDPTELQRQELDPIIDLPGEPTQLQRDRRTWSYGTVLRETADGWVDDERSAYALSQYRDCPYTPEGAIGLALDERGEGWIVGGETGQNSAFRCEVQSADTVRAAAQTAQIWRYGAAPAAPPGIDRVQPVQAPGPARLLFGGHAQCEGPCAGLDRVNIGPDRYLGAAIDLAATMHPTPGGPRALIYTGTRVAPGTAAGALTDELGRYAQLIGSASGRIPTFVAPSSTDAGVDAPAFRAAFAGLPAPQGSGSAGAIAPGSGEGGPGARTYFAMDTTGPEGTLRVLMINNAAGSLEASAPGQREWLVGELADARARGIPVVVAGSRPLSGAGQLPDPNVVAADGDDVARLLVTGGASAYLFDSPERNASTRIPANAAEQIPAFGSGSLGYDLIQGESPDPADNGLALLEVTLAARDARTNRAPVTARVVPVIEDVAVDAQDGVVLRRSSAALFSGLGRRPRAGHRRDGQSALIMDPYVQLPNPICAAGQCAERIPTEFSFASSNPEIGDFVRVDPSQAQGNPRAVFLGPDEKPVTDPTSGLFCAFNPGETTISVVAGGLRYSTRVQVQAGSPRRPCGTRPVAPREPAVGESPPTGAAAPPVAAGAEANPTPAPPPPVAPVVPPAAPAPPLPTVLAVPVVATVLPSLPPLPALPLTPPAPPNPLLVVPPPPVGSVARPSPPGGATVRVYEEKREEEEAFEQSSAAVRYEPDRAWSVPDAAFTLAVLIIAAGAGTTIAKRGRRRRTPELSYARVRDHRHTR